MDATPPAVAPMLPGASPTDDTDGVIPVVVLLGIVVGRWWLVPLAGVAWAIILVLANDLGPAGIPVAAALAMANTAVGVGCHKLAAVTLRHVRSRSA
jgi:hypothetical protein